MRCPAVTSQWFHYLAGLLVLGNFVVMCFYMPGEQSTRSRALYAVELALAGVFVGEALLRIAASGGAALPLLPGEAPEAPLHALQLTGRGPRAGVLGYFWNAGEVFDFAVILASLAGLVSGKFPNLNMARIFRRAARLPAL